MTTPEYLPLPRLLEFLDSDAARRAALRGFHPELVGDADAVTRHPAKLAKLPVECVGVVASMLEPDARAAAERRDRRVGAKAAPRVGSPHLPTVHDGVLDVAEALGAIEDSGTPAPMVRRQAAARHRLAADAARIAARSPHLDASDATVALWTRVLRGEDGFTGRITANTFTWLHELATNRPELASRLGPLNDYTARYALLHTKWSPSDGTRYHRMVALWSAIDAVVAPLGFESGTVEAVLAELAGIDASHLDTELLVALDRLMGAAVIDSFAHWTAARPRYSADQLVALTLQATDPQLAAWYRAQLVARRYDSGLGDPASVDVALSVLSPSQVSRLIGSTEARTRWFSLVDTATLRAWWSRVDAVAGLRSLQGCTGPLYSKVIGQLGAARNVAALCQVTTSGWHVGISPLILDDALAVLAAELHAICGDDPHRWQMALQLLDGWPAGLDELRGTLDAIHAPTASPNPPDEPAA